MRHGTCRKCLKPIHQWEPDRQWFHDDLGERPWEWLTNPEVRCAAEPRMESDLIEKRLDQIAQECNAVDIASCAKHGPEFTRLVEEGQ